MQILEKLLDGQVWEVKIRFPNRKVPGDGSQILWNGFFRIWTTYPLGFGPLILLDLGNPLGKGKWETGPAILSDSDHLFTGKRPLEKRHLGNGCWPSEHLLDFWFPSIHGGFWYPFLISSHCSDYSRDIFIHVVAKSYIKLDVYMRFW